jgi:hypothetical protein
MPETIILEAGRQGWHYWLKLWDYRVLGSRDFTSELPGVSSSNIEPEQRRLLLLSLTAGVVDGFRWCILGAHNLIYLSALAVVLVTTAFLAGLRVHHFRKFEKIFADLI